MHHLTFALIFGIIVFVSGSFQEKSIYSEDYSNVEDRDARQVEDKCFKATKDDEELEVNIKTIFQQEAITKCFKPLQEEEIYRCLTSNNMTMAQSFDNVTSEYCPTWKNSKRCVFDFLKSNCIEAEVELIRKSAAFNSEVALPFLMCEPNWNSYLWKLLQRSMQDGLWKCFTDNKQFLQQLQNCTLGSQYVLKGMFPEYKLGVKKFAECATPALETCAHGDSLEELKLTAIWALIEKTFERTYVAFWKEFQNY